MTNKNYFEMDIKKEGQYLLKNHSVLYKKLIKIPEERELIYLEEKEDNKLFGKPRFNVRYYQWPKDLLKRLRNHLQEIWDFFSKYSFHFDNTIIPLLSLNLRRESKKSVIFLLECDVWETDEVYGKYLIEKNNSQVKIAYYRFDKVFKEFILDTTEDYNIKKWIWKDAINQIKNQFSYLWSKLETEIITCIEEEYHREPIKEVSSDYLLLQLEHTKNIMDHWPEGALLSLGRISELWLLLSCNEQNVPYEDLIRKAEIRGIIDDHAKRLLGQIRKNYNSVKHKTNYKVKNTLVIQLVQRFSKFLGVV